MINSSENKNLNAVINSENYSLIEYNTKKTAEGKVVQVQNYRSMHSIKLPQDESFGGVEKCGADPENLDGDCGHQGYEMSELSTSAPGQKLGLISLAVIAFYNVSGGPFGIEASVKSGGNFYAIMGFIIAPFIWSLPEALVTAELGTTFPEASGAIAWVEEAFGKKVGIINGYVRWVGGVVDNAIYPALLMEYVMSLMSVLTEHEREELNSGYLRFSILSTMSIILAALNYSGLEIVGRSSIVICIISLSPFVILCILGIPKVEPHRWFEMPDTSGRMYDMLQNNENHAFSGPLPILVYAGIFLRPFTNSLFWNVNSFDAAASFAADVKDVKKTFAKGMFLALGMTFVFYLVPLLVAIGATESKQSDWEDGHMARIALEIGGPLLGGWTVFAAGISNIALFEAEMSADSLKLMGMAERGYLPKIFATRSQRFGTPVYGILAGLIAVILMGIADFSLLVEMLNFCYSISLILVYVAFVKLRFTHGHLERPYSVPVSKWGAILFILPPCLGICFIFLLSSWATLSFATFVIIFAIGLYELQKIAVANNWCEFADQSMKPNAIETENDDDPVFLIV